jgi:hypothetical protein
MFVQGWRCWLSQCVSLPGAHQLRHGSQAGERTAPWLSALPAAR